jgi:predicted protein tyrosine phosphatase
MQPKPNHQHILRLKHKGTYCFLYMCMANHYRHWAVVFNNQAIPYATSQVKPNTPTHEKSR